MGMSSSLGDGAKGNAKGVITRKTTEEADKSYKCAVEAMPSRSGGGEFHQLLLKGEK